MNAQQLYTRIDNADGKHQYEPHVLCVCGKCGMVCYNGIEQAEACCRPFVCNIHGEQTQRWCSECSTAKRELETQRELTEAELVTDYSGWVYHHLTRAEQSLIHGPYDDSGFHDSPAEFSRWWKENIETLPVPNFVFCCTQNGFSLDFDRVIENEAEQDDYHNEIADCISGETELRAAIDAFNEANKGTLTFHPDKERKVAVPR